LRIRTAAGIIQLVPNSPPQEPRTGTHAAGRRIDLRSPAWWRRLVFGDWHPLLRDPLDLGRLAFLAAAIIFLLAGSLEYAVRLAGTFLLLMGAQRLRLPRLFDLLFLVAMSLQAWGNALRLFEDIFWWDNLVHFAVPFASVPVLYVLNVRLGLLPDLEEEPYPRHRLGLVLFGVFNGIAIGALYEIYEYVAVNWLDAPLAIGYSDTIFDLTLDASGSLAGGVLLMLWASARWGTERRPL
jgi:hypothetical protein